MESYRKILTDGLWDRNPGLIQFLGICPLLAVSNSLINGLGLGLATLFVLVSSNLVVSLIRHLIPEIVRLPLFVLIIATLVTVVDLYTQAWFFDLWLGLGIFIPLIVTNCVILARAESFASRQAPLAAVVDGVAHGLGFALVLIVLGGCRELVGNGTLLAGSASLFGENFGRQGIVFGDFGFLLALLPPGAFLGLGLLIALRNLVVNRQQQAAAPLQEAMQINKNP